MAVTFSGTLFSGQDEKDWREAGNSATTEHLQLVLLGHMENFQNRLNSFWLRHGSEGGAKGSRIHRSSFHSLAKESAELQEMAKLSAHKREWQWQGRYRGRWWGRWLLHKCSFPGARGYPNIKRITHAAATAGPISWQIVLPAGWESVFLVPNGKMDSTQWCQKSISLLITYKICFSK